MINLLRQDNPLIEMARSGKRLTNIFAAIPLSPVILFGAQLIGAIPAFLILIAIGLQRAQAGSAGYAAGQAVLLIFSFAPIFLLLFLWIHFFEKRPFWTIGLQRSGAGGRYLRGLVVGLALFSAAIGIIALLGEVSQDPQPSIVHGTAALVPVLIIALGWAVQGPGEEALTRGWLMPVTGARYRPWLGVVVSSLVFAVYHSLNPDINPLAIVNLLLFGLFAAFYALAEGSLWGVFAIHAIWNWAEGNLFGLPVSGLGLSVGSLLNLKLTGPGVITGGEFGPEGGLAVTAVLIVGIAIIFIINRSKSTETVDSNHLPI